MTIYESNHRGKQVRIQSLIVSTLVDGLVFVVCYIIAHIYAEGAYVNWESLGTPSPQGGERISIEFDQDSTATVYLSSVSGNGLQKGSPTLCTSSSCWVNVNSTQNRDNASNIKDFSSECPNKYLMMKSPPIKQHLFCKSKESRNYQNVENYRLSNRM